MLLTYAWTVRLLAKQQQNIGGTGPGWSFKSSGATQSAGYTKLYIAVYTNLFLLKIKKLVYFNGVFLQSCFLKKINI